MKRTRNQQTPPAGGRLLPLALGVAAFVLYLPGLGNGLTQEEISEIITHLSMYAGWPAAMTASHVAVDVFESKKD